MRPKVTCSLTTLRAIREESRVAITTAKKREKKGDVPSSPQDGPRIELLQVLSEERLGLFPRVFRRRFMIAASIVAEKTMPRFGINLHLKRYFLGRQFSFDLVHLIQGNQWIFSAEEKIHRTFNLTRARERARITHRDAAAVEGHRAFHIFIMMGRSQIREPPTHAKADDAKGAGLDVALRLEMRDCGADVFHRFTIDHPLHGRDRL